MDAAAVSPSRPAATDRLLAHCLPQGESDALPRIAAGERLEALIGSELAERLVRALSRSAR
jgi:hypothetical protein